MKIVIDAFGGDNAPESILEGVTESLCRDKDLQFVITGDKQKVADLLTKYGADTSRTEIVHAPDIISNNEAASSAVRTKPESSLVKALTLLKQRDDIDAFLCAGSTGAILMGGIFIVGRMDGILRPALAPALPTVKGGLVCLIDCGANADCKPENLAQFAIMGASYMQSMYGIENPRVALVSNGTEDKKGNELSKAAFEMLKQSPVNFVGNMEARDALSGNCDVLVTDGFTGNVLLKTIEGTATTVLNMLGGILKKNAPAGTDMGFVKQSFGEIMQLMDFNSLGGAPLLGVEKIMLKLHGSSNVKTVVNTVRQAKQLHENGMINLIKQKLTLGGNGDGEEKS